MVWKQVRSCVDFPHWGDAISLVLVRGRQDGGCVCTDCQRMSPAVPDAIKAGFPAPSCTLHSSHGCSLGNPLHTRVCHMHIQWFQRETRFWRVSHPPSHLWVRHGWFSCTARRSKVLINMPSVMSGCYPPCTFRPGRAAKPVETKVVISVE